MPLNWTVEYEPTVVPESASPSWSRISQSPFTRSVSGGILTLSARGSTSFGQIAYARTESSDANSATFETKVFFPEFVSKSDTGAYIFINNDSHGGRVSASIRGDKIIINVRHSDGTSATTSTVSQDFTTSMKKVRLTYDNVKSESQVYIDGSSIFKASSTFSTASPVTFNFRFEALAEASGGVTGSITSSWDYVAYLVGHAVAPGGGGDPGEPGTTRSFWNRRGAWILYPSGSTTHSENPSALTTNSSVSSISVAGTTSNPSLWSEFTASTTFRSDFVSVRLIRDSSGTAELFLKIFEDDSDLDSVNSKLGKMLATTSRKLFTSSADTEYTLSLRNSNGDITFVDFKAGRTYHVVFVKGNQGSNTSSYRIITTGNGTGSAGEIFSKSSEPVEGDTGTKMTTQAPYTDSMLYFKFGADSPADRKWLSFTVDEFNASVRMPVSIIRMASHSRGGPIFMQTTTKSTTTQSVAQRVFKLNASTELFTLNEAMKQIHSISSETKSFKLETYWRTYSVRPTSINASAHPTDKLTKLSILLEESYT